MNGILASHWLVVGDMTVPRLVAQESAALIVLAASLLVFRTFRERYLLIWILGCLPLCRRSVCLHKCAGLLASIAAHFDWRNRLRGSPGAAMARFGHFASRARNFLSPDCADRVHPVDPLPLGSLGNWSVAPES